MSSAACRLHRRTPFTACAWLRMRFMPPMAGKTGMVVGRWHECHFVNLPIKVVTSRRRKVNPQGDLWLSVLEGTGQPVEFK